jgi:hypothetical protein
MKGKSTEFMKDIEVETVSTSKKEEVLKQKAEPLVIRKSGSQTLGDASGVDSPQLSSKKGRTFSRRSIKMEGWLEVCDETVKTWVKRWCALEGGYIWFFENPEDNNKANGTNKPKSMVSVTKSVVAAGNKIESFEVPDVATKPNLFTLNAGESTSIRSCIISSFGRWQTTIAHVSGKQRGLHVVD